MVALALVLLAAAVVFCGAIIENGCFAIAKAILKGQGPK